MRTSGLEEVPSTMKILWAIVDKNSIYFKENVNMQMVILVIILFTMLFLINFKLSLSGKLYTFKDALVDTTIETAVILFFLTVILAVSKTISYYL